MGPKNLLPKNNGKAKKLVKAKETPKKDFKVTINDIVAEVHKAVTTKDINKKDQETLNMVEATINELKDTSISGVDFKTLGSDELSKILGSLALLKDTLGEMLAIAKRNVSYCEARLDFRKANMQTNRAIIDKLTTMKGKAPNLDDIHAEIVKQSFIEKTILIFREEHYDRINNKLWSLNSLLNVITTRISVLQSNQADTRFGDTTLDYDVTGGLNKIRKEEDLDKV